MRDPVPVPDAGSEAGWLPTLNDYKVGLRGVSLSVSSDRPAWVQLAHPWFPATDVRVNGQAAEPLTGALNLMVLRVQAGDTRIELLPRLTQARSLALQVSGTALLGTLAVAAWLALRPVAARRPAGRARAAAARELV